MVNIEIGDSNIIQDPLLTFQPKFIRMFGLIMTIMGVILYLVAIFSISNITNASLLSVICGIIILFLYHRKQNKIASFLIFIFCMTIQYYQGFTQHSAYAMCFLPMFLILTPILLPSYYIVLFFIMDFAVILLYVEMGIFTWNQTFCSEYNLPLVNNVLGLVPLLIVGYFLARILSQVLISSLEQKNTLLKKAEEGNTAKTLFLANISHEIRTPINAIIGFSQILQDGGAGELKKEQKDIIDDIINSGKILDSLLNTVLEITQFDQNKIKIQKTTFDLKDLIKNCIQVISLSLKERNIHFNLEISEETGLIFADKNRISQVIFNLLSNAIKFTPPEGNVGLIVVRKEKFLQIIVWDTGMGISSSEIETLFQPFHRVLSNNKEIIPGTGLGLSISKKIVQLHGGSIDVESEVGKGSRFVVSIPIEKSN